MRVEKADLEQEYVSYGFLCGFAHNHFTAIIFPPRQASTEVPARAAI